MMQNAAKISHTNFRVTPLLGTKRPGTKRQGDETARGRNGKGTKRQGDETARGRNGKRTKWQADEMASGRNGKGTKRQGDETARGRNDHKATCRFKLTSIMSGQAVSNIIRSVRKVPKYGTVPLI
jgi:hypothetical protein